jgi:membrane-bound inhibitor of C-type lysozyme
VPATALAPDGVATAFSYANQALDKDSGLWVAGDGDPTNALGTVDGYIYAIPMCAVFRRNTSAFDRDNNQNGGVATPGPSDRPDGLFYDIVVENDLLDLRQHVSASGWQYSELLDKNTNYLLDNGLKSEITTTPLGGGVQGHTTIWADEIGSVDNSGANLIRDFDGACRTFSDRPIIETVVLRYYPADQVGGGSTWDEGSILTIDPTNLPIYPYPNSNLSAAAPGSVSILGVPRAAYIRTLAGDATFSIDLPDAIITGLGQVPAESVTFRIPTQFHASGSDGNGFVLLYVAISYPSGQGLTKTPTDAYGTASFVNELPANLPATAPYNFASGSGSFDAPHREVTLRYTTSDLTFTSRIFNSNSFLLLPDRAVEVSSVVKGTGGTYTGSITISDDGYGVTIEDIDPNWTDGAYINDDDVTITYKAVRPMPDNNVQFTIWYEARASQTIRDLSLGTTLRVVPRYVSKDIYCLVSGPGSLDDSYPFPVQSVQTPGVYPSSAGSFSGDHELDGSGTISIATFDSDTGFVRVPALIPVVSDPQTLIFNRDLGDIDIEGRSFFKEVPAGYIPSSFGQPLSDPKKHKNLVPMVCELVDTSAIGVAGTLVLVVLSRWATFDAKNSVAFDSDLATNYTTASVYRLKGNPLSNRRSN